MSDKDDLSNIKTLTELCSAIAYGHYENADVDTLFDFTKAEKHPLIADLSESIGFMLVKIEGREFALEMKIRDLEKANEKIDEYSKNLEFKVEERTRELKEKNEVLIIEVETRLKIQKALEEANEKLTMISNLDGLTGLANRRRLDSYLEKEWRALQRTGAPLGLIICDVDHFKLYNDTYGHQMGDDTLKQIATALKVSMRRARDMAARYGGEEFAAILPDTHIEGVKELAEKIRTRVEQLNIPHESSKVCDHATISLGGASVIPSGDMTAKDLIEMADLALYEAKEKGGRNCVKIRQSL